MDAISRLKIEDLSYSYPETGSPALNRINLEVPEGQFLIVAGESGSGKSTLLRLISGLAPEFYGGCMSGRILLDGVDLKELKRRDLVTQVGLVFQNPESQLVMMSVEQELIFGLENLGLDNSLMQRRLMEVSGAMGLTRYLRSFIPELSGGQKQKVALASVLAMQPQILLLDEPTSQLDPIAAEEFLSVVRRLNEDQGLTVILIEQRLERCCHLADRIILMDEGQIGYDYSVREPGSNCWPFKISPEFLPPVPRLFAALGYKEIPMTVKQGRQVLQRDFLLGYVQKTDLGPALEPDLIGGAKPPLVDIKGLYFTYPEGPEVLKNLNLQIKSGDFIAVMGENGAGKSTLLKNINGLLKPGRGQIKVCEKDAKKLSIEELAEYIGYLPQNCNDYLFLPSVEEELAFTLKNRKIPPDEGYKKLIIDRLKLEPLLNSNPRDLSAGEAQRAAMASILSGRPALLLLDEPTRGLDYQMKTQLGELLQGLNEDGIAIVMVTHDVEFVAQYARDILLMFEGRIISQGRKYKILPQSTFYAPQMCKLFHHIIDGVVNPDEAKEALNRLTYTMGTLPERTAVASK